MEIGGNIENEGSVSSSNANSRHLIANLRYDGIRLIECETEQKKILKLHSANWIAAKDPAYLIDECEKFFDKNDLKPASTDGVLWLLSLSKFCLIPDVLYQQGNGEALLNQTTRLEVGEHIFSDFWTRRDIVGVYALPEKILTYIRSKNKNTRMAHNGFALNSLYNLQEEQDDFCFLQVSNAFAELFIVQEQKVVFYNQFPHDVKEDLLYYILFTLEQNRILAPEITLYTSGEIQKGDAFHSLLSKYIGKVEDVKLPADLSASRQLATNELRKHINLIAAL